MSQIIIIEKPDQISYEQIHELLYEAHAVNREIGFYVKTAYMSASELEAHVGADGKCFVAMDGDKLAGVIAGRIVNRDKWFARESFVEQILLAVHPSYRGRHIGTALHEKLVAFTEERGLRIIETQTAHKNKAAQSADKKWGFRPIGYYALPGLDHYTVCLYKWIHNDGPSALNCRLHFIKTKANTILRYKPGKIPRF